jgi:outer membrane protein assembly factor BamB
MLRLINLDNMSGHGGPGFTGGEVFSMSVPQGNEVLTMPAVWINPSDQSTWVFVANGNGMSGLKLAIDHNTGNPSLQTQWSGGPSGSSPIVANGVLYLAGNGGIYAFNPVTHAQLFHDGSIGGNHWESPIVADGVLYITDESGQLTAYTPNGIVPPPLTNIFLPLATH